MRSCLYHLISLQYAPYVLKIIPSNVCLEWYAVAKHHQTDTTSRYWNSSLTPLWAVHHCKRDNSTSSEAWPKGEATQEHNDSWNVLGGIFHVPGEQFFSKAIFFNTVQNWVQNNEIKWDNFFGVSATCRRSFRKLPSVHKDSLDETFPQWQHKCLKCNGANMKCIALGFTFMQPCFLQQSWFGERCAWRVHGVPFLLRCGE